MTIPRLRVSRCTVALVIMLGLWAVPGSSTQDCSIIQSSDLGSTDAPSTTGLVADTFNTTQTTNINETVVGVKIMDFNIVCLAQGAKRNTWRAVSLVVNYTYNGTERFSQFQFECDESNWTAAVNGSMRYTRTDPAYADLNTTMRTDCAWCADPRQLSSANNVHHCSVCHESCSQGLRRCTSDSEDSCCNYFIGDQCTSSCPNISQANNNSLCCAKGYQSVDCDQDIDECLNSTGMCMNDGVCNNTIGSFVCVCPQGYSGEQCEDDIDECNPNPCLNGGMCEDNVGFYTCSCPAGFTDTNCKTNINECDPNPCMNGGYCSDSANQYTCNCTEGWSGSNCDVCTLNACLNCTIDASQNDRAVHVCLICQQGYTLSSGNCVVSQISGLSAGSVAGIVVAILIGIILLAILVALMIAILYVQKKNKFSSAYRASQVQADKDSSIHVMKNPVYLAPDSVDGVDSGVRIESDEHLAVNEAALEYEEDSDES